MKIIHTSDWHIGHKLYGNDRTDEHRLFLNWLVHTIKNENVDVLLVCGDIFDVAYPANQALRTYYEFLKEMVATPCRHIIITGGNHDSIGTLEAPREILKVLNVTVIGGAPENSEEQIIELSNRDGQTEAVVCAVPFLRDKDIRTPVAGETSTQRIRATKQGIVDYYHNLATKVAPFNETGVPLIATGHLYMQGSQLSDSERDVQLGNQAGVEAAKFPKTFDYYALGHIHRAQTISQNPDVVYSGSPIALSFSEQHNKKSVRLIQIAGNRLSHELIAIPPFRQLKSIKGGFSKAKEQFENLQPASLLPDWVELLIEEEEYDALLPGEADRFVEESGQSNKKLQILRHTIKFANRNIEKYLFEDTGASLSEMKAGEVFQKLLDQNDASGKSELMNTFNELLEIVHHQENVQP
jgi:DNA repair protein SbcD/Mre11